MRTEKEILRKVAEWKDNPIMVPGMHRLFVYLKWDSIPQEIRQFYPEEAKLIWDEQDTHSMVDSLNEDMLILIKSIYKELQKKSITISFGLLPLLLADSFVSGLKIGNLQAQLTNIINEYADTVKYDRSVAEAYSLIKVTEFIEAVVAKNKLKLDINLQEITTSLLNSPQYKLQDVLSTTPLTELPQSLDEQIDKALDEYNELKQSKTNIQS